MAISLTPAAADRVKSFLATRGKGLGLRLGVRKTGCSGFAYVVNYADDSAAQDHVFEDQGVKVFVDPESLPLINGTTVVRERSGPTSRAIGLAIDGATATRVPFMASRCPAARENCRSPPGARPPPKRPQRSGKRQSALPRTKNNVIRLRGRTSSANAFCS